MEYSDDWKARLADELERLPADYTHTVQAIVDYARLRAEVRACR